MRLLPAFDQYVVAAPARRAGRARRPSGSTAPGGWFSPVLLVDGVMAGVWALEDDARDDRAVRVAGRRGPGRAEAEAARLHGTPLSSGELGCAPRRRSSRSPPPTAPAAAGSAPPLAERLGVEFLDRAIPTGVADRLQVPLDDALAHDESLGDAIGRLASSFALLPELAGALVQAGVLAGEDYRRETERLIREHADGGAVDPRPRRRA